MRENPWLHLGRETHPAPPLRERSLIATVISALARVSAQSPERLQAGARISPQAALSHSPQLSRRK